MKLPDKIYEFLKWAILIGIPACSTLYCTLEPLFGWGYGDVVSKTCNAVCVFLGTLIGISTINYRKGLNNGLQ